MSKTGYLFEPKADEIESEIDRVKKAVEAVSREAGSEYVSIEIEPLTAEQKEANDSLRDLVISR